MRMTDQPAALTVEDLLSTASLGLRPLAGNSGLDRSVLWAHSCEMSDPTEWLGPHELLLTVGLCVPAAPEKQVDFIRRLDETHLAGLVLGDHETCPPVSEGMLAEADRRGFPVLLADARIPWAAIGRHVAAANASSQTMQVLKLSKLYQVAANSDDDYSALIEQLSKLLGVGLIIMDQQTGMVVLEAAHIGAANHSQTTRNYPLPSTHPAELRLMEFAGESLDSFILVHLLKVLALNADRLLGAVNHRIQESEQAFQRLYSNKHCPEATALLEAHAENGSYHVATFAPELGARFARQVALLRLPVLVGFEPLHGHAFIPAGIVGAFRGLSEQAGIHVGLSSSFSDVRDVRAAAEEAKRTLGVARFSDRLWVEFEGTTVAVLTRSRREADEIIAGVLGPLAEPSEASTKLRETLFAYLRNDRHWQQTADELGVHRQTLSYRLGRIEEETGMNANRSADLSAFWIAYQAWESVAAG